MLVPAFGPVAMPCAAQPQGAHCVRKAMSSHAAMPCHHAMAPLNEGELLQASFEAANPGNCCQSHCCCGATTSEWAQPVSSLLSVLNLLVEPARRTDSAEPHSIDASGSDSARAPPRG
ncbi:MAG: hypothetical protein WBV41_11720 [Terriglobales bacterium]